MVTSTLLINHNLKLIALFLNAETLSFITTNAPQDITLVIICHWLSIFQYIRGFLHQASGAWRYILNKLIKQHCHIRSHLPQIFMSQEQSSTVTLYSLCCFILPHNIVLPDICCFFIVCFLPLECKLHKNRFWFKLMSPQHLEKCLAYSRASIFIKY